MRGGPQRIGQANNVFVFPGLGLGTIVSGASEVTAGMISASSAALAESLSAAELEARCLMPEVSRLWDICGAVALQVACCAVSDGVAPAASKQELQDKIVAARWRPAYPDLVEA